MRVNTKRLLVILAIAAGLVFSGASRAKAEFVPLIDPANAIPLTDLLSGQTFTAGDKVFSNWQFTGDFSPDGLAVVPGYDQTGYGFELFGSTLNAPRNVTRVGTLSYQVASDSPMVTVSGRFVGSTSPGGSITFTESIYDTNLDLLGSLVTAYPSPVQNSFDLSSPQRTLNIDKLIYMKGPPIGGATVSIVYQTFQSVPEPGTLTLFSLGIGVLGLTIWRNRSLKKKP